MWINLATCRDWNCNQRTHNGLLVAAQKEGELEYETPRGTDGESLKVVIKCFFCDKKGHIQKDYIK